MYGQPVCSNDRVQLSLVLKQTGKLGHHKVLNCFGWKPPRCGILPPRLHQALRDVIAVADAVLDRMTWRKTVPGLVIEKSGKKTGAIPLAFPDGFVRDFQPTFEWRPPGENPLGGFPGLAIDDALVLAIRNPALMRDEPGIDRVGQHPVEMSAGEALTT